MNLHDVVPSPACDRCTVPPWRGNLTGLMAGFLSSSEICQAMSDASRAGKPGAIQSLAGMLKKFPGAYLRELRRIALRRAREAREAVQALRRSAEREARHVAAWEEQALQAFEEDCGDPDESVAIRWFEESMAS